MSELNAAHPVTYFNLHAEGCGYLNRVRTVTPEQPRNLAATHRRSRALLSNEPCKL